MMDFWCTPSFDNLYQEFIVGSTGGKIFIIKEIKSGETKIGRGTTILLKEANPYVLSVLIEKYQKDKTSIIGDLELLFELDKFNDKEQTERHNEEKIYHANRALKRQRQLYSIMIRKHKSLNATRFSLRGGEKE